MGASAVLATLARHSDDNFGGCYEREFSRIFAVKFFSLRELNPLATALEVSAAWCMRFVTSGLVIRIQFAGGQGFDVYEHDHVGCWLCGNCKFDLHDSPPSAYGQPILTPANNALVRIHDWSASEPNS